MERKCLEKWNNQKVLVLGQIDRKKHDQQGQLHLCLKNCQVARYGEGQPVTINHVWLFTNLKEEELAFFGQSGDASQIKPFSESNLAFNLMPIIGRVHPYWRKAIHSLDYGVQFLNIYHGELTYISILIKQYNNLVEIEQKLVYPLLQKKRQEIKANHKFFSQLIAYYRQFLYRADILNNDGTTVALKDFINELEKRLKEQRLVFPPEKTSAEISEIIQTLKLCFYQAEKLYQEHLKNAPRLPKRTIPKTTVGFGKF